MTKQIVVNGIVDIELDGLPIRLQAKGQEIHVMFSSFTALRRFRRFFIQRGLSMDQLPSQYPINELINHFDIFYHLAEDPIARMGPTIKGSWWGRYLGLSRLKFDTKVLIRSWFQNLFKR